MNVSTLQHSIPYTLQVNVEDASVLKTIKSLLRQLKGVTSVKQINTPASKMTEEEFRAKINHSIASERKDGLYKQHPGENINDYIDRLLQI